MALNYTLKTASVMDGETEIATVRGLSLNDIVQLLLINREAAGVLFDELNGRPVDEITQVDVMTVGHRLIDAFPAFVAQIIAVAADAYPEEGEDATEMGDISVEESPVQTIMGMPAGLQISCLEKIGELTFVGTSPKKLLALALKTAQSRSQSEAAAQ